MRHTARMARRARRVVSATYRSPTGSSAPTGRRLPLLAGRVGAKTSAVESAVARLDRTAGLVDRAAGLAGGRRPTTASHSLANQSSCGAGTVCGGSGAATRFAEAAAALASVATGAGGALEATGCADWVNALAVVATRIAERAAGVSAGHASVAGASASA